MFFPRRFLLIDFVFYTFMIFVFSLTGSSAFCQGATVVVNPFSIYGDAALKEIVPGLESALAGRLAADGYSVLRLEESAQTVGNITVDATITNVAGTYSIDLTVNPGNVRRFGKATSKTEVLALLEKLAGDVKPTIKAAALQKELKAEVLAKNSPAPKDDLDRRLKAAFSTHRAGPTIKGEVRSIVASDADGDGAVEILLLVDGWILAFRDNGTEIVQVWDSPAPNSFSPICMSAGDVDGNGVNELFVAGINNSGVVSQAFEWFGSMLAPKGERIRGFVRVALHPKTGASLLGMTSGLGDEVFSWGIKNFVWNGAEYRGEERVAGAPGNLVSANLDWATLNNNDEPYIVATTQDDRLAIYDSGWKKVFQGADEVKGARSLLGGDSGGSFYRIHGKTLCWEAPNGQHLLLTYRNYSSLSRIFTRATSYSHGQILAFRWDGLALLDVALGPKFRGFVADVAIASSSGGAPQEFLYAALVESEGTLFKKETTKILVYQLPAP